MKALVLGLAGSKDGTHTEFEPGAIFWHSTPEWAGAPQQR